MLEGKEEEVSNCPWLNLNWFYIILDDNKVDGDAEDKAYEEDKSLFEDESRRKTAERGRVVPAEAMGIWMELHGLSVDDQKQLRARG